MKVSDAIIKFLADKGVRNVFLLTGGAICHVTDSLNNDSRIKYICCHHESALSMATEAYSRIKEDIGVLIVTSGPGGSNSLTGVLSAFVDSIPMLVISGQCGTNQLIGNTGERQVGVQEADIISIVKPITKYAKLVLDKDMVLWHLDMVYKIAKDGRQGPVWLDIPVDIQAQQIDYEERIADIEKTGFYKIPTRIECDDDQIEWVAESLINAKRPILQVGHGVRLAKCLPRMHELINQIGCAVQTTWGAVDYLDDSDKRYAGHPGTWGQRWANMATQQADFILCLGTRLSSPQTGYNLESWGKNATKFVVDIDTHVLNRVQKFGCNVVWSSMDYFIDNLLEKIKGISLNYDSWLDTVQTLKAKYPVVMAEYYQEQLNSYVFLDRLSEMCDNNYVITSDVGTSFAGMFPVWKVKIGQRLINQSGLFAMGHALPSAIGSWFADSSKKQLCLCGDGGFQMNIQELQTIKHYNIPVKIFVFCNDGYLTIKHTEMNHFGRLTAVNAETGLSMPNFSKVAKAYGIKGYHIYNYKDMEKWLPVILNSNEPILCSVHTDPMQPIVPKLGAKLVDGKFLNVEFDDLVPYLER